ncbi:MAG: hypothetical protein Kow0074_12100 [Candidatus Zixiibacteriota bacterium]
MSNARRISTVGLASLFLILCSMLVAGSAYAQTGKIAGTVINKKTKEPIIGAAVRVEGTTLGALTDLDGNFQILAVPPGDHSVRAQLVGHTPVVMSNVVVRPNQTTTISLELEESTIELDAIEVVRERELIQMDEATTKRDVSADKIKTLPVTNVSDILKTQVGITVRQDRFYIRGGRAEEVLYTVDGVSMKDPLGGRGPTESLNLSGTEIENVSVIKGGWSAEYGEATSGIINVSTKSGSQRTQGHIEYFTDNLGTSSLNKYSFNYNRLEFTLGGPDLLFSQKLLPALGLGGPSDKLTYFINADFDRTDTYTPINNYTTPMEPAEFRYTKFLGFKVADRQQNSGNLGLKMTYRLSPDIRLTGIVKRSYERRMGWSWAYRYTPNTLPWIEDKNDRYSLTWVHNLSPSTFYQVIVSRFSRTYQQKPGDPNTPGGTYRPDQFLFSDEADHFVDVNSNGIYDAPEKWVDVYPDGIRNSSEFIDNDADGIYTPGVDEPLYDFNGNGEWDIDQGELFEDANDNNIWDSGDVLEADGNFNGVYDPERERDVFGPTANDIPESFIDGDRSIGEPFVDINKNGVYDDTTRTPLGGYGEPFTDLSGDGQYQGPNDPWVPGVPFEDLNGNGVFDLGGTIPSGSYSTIDNDYDLGEPFNDANGNGVRDRADGFYDRGWDEDALWHQRISSTTTLNMDLTSQVRREHEVKVGFKFSQHDLNLGDLMKPYIRYTNEPDGGPFPGRGELRDFYEQKPAQGAFYIRDKMEYGQMIANVGFRYDYFIQSDNADLTGEGLEDEFNTRVVSEDFRDKFAPRIAFSYPISDKAKVFFNYGHFYQLPQLTFMYRRATQLNADQGIIGNVNLDFQKTIQYEFGLQYLLSPEYVLSMQGYYKDDFGRIGTSNIVGVGSQEARNFYENRDYARSRGLEFELEKKYGNYVSGTATYNLSWAYGKASANSLDFFENFYDFSGAVTIKEFPLDWDQRHAITLILDFRVPPDDHPKLFGITLPDNFGLNIFWQYGSGFPYTPGSLHPGAEILRGTVVEENSKRYPANSNVDIRFNKDFRFSTVQYTFEVWINNVFDTKNVASVGLNTGRADTFTNLGGIPYMGLEPTSPRSWEAGRQIRLGLGMNF